MRTYSEAKKICWLWLLSRVTPWLIARAAANPYFNLPGYMNRGWIMKYNKYLFGIGARIHEILKSDSDRAYHDHPWRWYITIILLGGYLEIKPTYDKSGLYRGEKRTWYGPGSILFRRAKDLHRLEIPIGQPATTLFITGKWMQDWGFVPNPNWKIFWKDYLAAEDAITAKVSDDHQVLEYLCCSCKVCDGLTYFGKYDTEEEKAALKEDFRELLATDREPFTLNLVVRNDRVGMPAWCKCEPTTDADLPDEVEQ